MSIEQRTVSDKVDRAILMLAELGVRMDTVERRVGELEEAIHGRGEPGARPSPWPDAERS